MWITKISSLAVFFKLVIIKAMDSFFEKLKPADIIAFFVLMFAMYIISIGINHTVSGVVIMICTYYFVKKSNYDNTKTD